MYVYPSAHNRNVQVLCSTWSCCSVYVLKSVCAGGLASGAMDYEVLCAQLAKKGGKKRKKQKKDSKLLSSRSLTLRVSQSVCITGTQYFLE